MAVPEAPLERTAAGLVPAGEGWFVVNCRDAAWRRRPGRGFSLNLTGTTADQCEDWFAMLGMNIVVLEPGKPSARYHREADAEGFLVLSGEAILIVEGQERPLRRWDFFHCPPQTEHILVGAGDGLCAVLACGSREFMGRPDWGVYTVDETARRYAACVDEETSDPGRAYAAYPDPEPIPYQDGFLPD